MLLSTFIRAPRCGPQSVRAGLLCAGLALSAGLASEPAAAQADRPAIGGGRLQAGAADDDFGGGSCRQRAVQVNRLLERAAGTRVFGPAPDHKDIAYGNKPRQRLDVFVPKGADRAAPAPIIVMVHGGGWCVGDKALGAVTENKVAHWVPRGFVFVSVGYPMIPDGSDALQQAADVARAVAYVQGHAADWGGDGRRVILMGHSAGAHLVSLVNADATLRAAAGVKPILGVIALDSGATDVPAQMQKSMPRVKGRYEEAFGTSAAGWAQASPLHRLDKSAAPWLGICSSRRADDPCAQAQAYADKSRALGVRAVVLPVDKGHGPINRELGQGGAYTAEVDQFLASLDPDLARRLPR